MKTESAPGFCAIPHACSGPSFRRFAAADDSAGVASDYEIFVGGNDPHRAFAVRAADRIFVGGVALAVDFNSEVSQSSAYFPSHVRVVLADSTSEDQRVDAFQHRGHRSDLLAQVVAEHLAG